MCVYYNYFVVNVCIIFIISLASLGNIYDYVISSAIILTAVLGDTILKVCESDLSRAFVDSSTHGILGLLSWAAVTLHIGNRYSRYEIICCGILSSFIDVDHFVAARSVKLINAMNLHRNRPFFHCSTIPLILALLNIFIFNNIRSNLLFVRYVWLLFVAFSSHQIRDANRRGLWFYPFGSTPPLSDISYILLTLILPYLIIFFFSSYWHNFINFKTISNMIANLSLKNIATSDKQMYTSVVNIV